MFCLCFLWKELFPLFFCNIVSFWVKRYCILRYYCLFIHSTLSYGTTAIICLYHQLIFARTYITSRGTKSPDSYHAITPVNVDICPPIISVEEKISSEKRQLKSFIFLIHKSHHVLNRIFFLANKTALPKQNNRSNLKACIKKSIKLHENEKQH